MMPCGGFLVIKWKRRNLETVRDEEEGSRVGFTISISPDI
jgi:hypothetical protein